jgi:hypothetical protein
MRAKQVLALAALLAAGTAVSYAAIPTCVAGTLSGVYVNTNGTSNGFTCEDADKIYSNFVYVTAGADPSAAQVNLALDDNTAILQTGFHITSNVQGLDWETAGFSLAYNVTVDQAACAAIYGTGDTCTITGAQGQFQGAFASNAAMMVDTLTPGGTITVTGTSTATETQNLTLAPQPITTTNILVSGNVAGHTDPIDQFGLDLYQTVTSSSVPEPATLSLIGAGLLGIGLSQRRRAGRV